MPLILVQTETDNPQSKCWDYTVRIEHGTSPATQHQIRLAWVDHEHWSGGRIAPSKVLQTVIEHLISHGMEAQLPAKFDAAKARRWIPGIDQELRQAM